MTATSEILDFAAAPPTLPVSVRADTLRQLSDTLAVGAAGNTISHIFGPDSEARARVLDGWALSTDRAAFANGYAIHSLEWDAVHEPAVVHAMSVVTAALLAISDERRGSDPEHFLTCLAVGVDIAAGLGISATEPMRFFRPATAGLVGASLAAARLINISREYYDDVLGYAYSFAGGTMQAHVEGSNALPLQIGHAARSAITAVNLVSESITGAPHDVLEGQFGYSALIEPLDLSRYTADLGKIWRISELSTKPYPSGRASHAVLATLADIRDSGRAIDSLVAHVPPLVARLVGRPMRADMTPAYARLCLPFLSALMLRTGRIDPRMFSVETFADRELAAFAEKVTVIVNDCTDPNALSPQVLEVRYADGTVVFHTITDTLGSPNAPLNHQQAAAKRELCKIIAGGGDPRIFDDPLGYATDPR